MIVRPRRWFVVALYFAFLAAGTALCVAPAMAAEPQAGSKAKQTPSDTAGGLGESIALEAAADQQPSAPAARYPEVVLDDRPVAYWRFSPGEVVTEFASAGSETLKAVAVGDVRVVEGPRPEGYPGFSPDNQAVQLNGNYTYLRVNDPGANSPLDFGNGDSITIEAWVNPRAMAGGQQVYIIWLSMGNAAYPVDVVCYDPVLV